MSKYLDAYDRYMQAPTDAGRQDALMAMIDAVHAAIPANPPTATTSTPPIVHIRIHSDYQSSIKGVAPDLTVTLDMPADGSVDDAALDKAIRMARLAATLEFGDALDSAWTACKRINAELSGKVSGASAELTDLHSRKV